MAVEDSAALVLSEILTNAVVHARVSRGREIQTCFRREADGVRIAVDDASDKQPTMRAPDVEGGRGLTLVACLSDDWGVSDRAGPGKSVWAVLKASYGEGGDDRCWQ
ncbi:ATP-binding protein [Streptomyces sp. NPDC002537]